MDVTLGRDEADEALVADHVAALGVGVDQAFFLPLAQALVFAFCKGIRRKNISMFVDLNKNQATKKVTFNLRMLIVEE